MVLVTNLLDNLYLPFHSACMPWSTVYEKDRNAGRGISDKLRRMSWSEWLMTFCVLWPPDRHDDRDREDDVSDSSNWLNKKD